MNEKKVQLIKIDFFIRRMARAFNEHISNLDFRQPN